MSPGVAQHVEGGVLALHARLFGHELAAGHHRDVLDRVLASIAEAGALDRRHFQTAAQPVDDQRGQGLALDVLGDDQKRAPAAHHRLEHVEQRLQARELLLVDTPSLPTFCMASASIRPTKRVGIDIVRRAALAPTCQTPRTPARMARSS
jgi:hypothetical protein